MMHSFDITSIKDERVVEARELTSAAGRARFQKTRCSLGSLLKKKSCSSRT
jgi:hypothetical protein